MDTWMVHADRSGTHQSRDSSTYHHHLRVPVGGGGGFVVRVATAVRRGADGGGGVGGRHAFDETNTKFEKNEKKRNRSSPDCFQPLCVCGLQELGFLKFVQYRIYIISERERTKILIGSVVRWVCVTCNKEGGGDSA